MLGTKMKSEGRVSAEFMQRAVQEAETRRRELAEATSALADYRPAGKLSVDAYVAAELARAGHHRGPLEALRQRMGEAAHRFEAVASIVHLASDAIAGGW